jgi:DNA-directed RNA polymerase specialized sigma24 family protein
MTEREFADIVGRTKKVVLSAIEKNLASRFYHSIDDVVQETYLRAYSSLTKGKFRGESSLERS